MERNVFDFTNVSSRILENIQKYGSFQIDEDLSEIE